MITIRQCRPDDWERVKLLRLAALADAPYAFPETLEEAKQMPDSGWQTIAIRNSRGEESIHALAFNDEEPIGMAGGFISQTDRNRAHVAALWIDPRFRGAGIGKGLVRFIVNWASNLGAKVLTATVTLDNLKAQALYKKSGFEFCEAPWSGKPAPENPEIPMKKPIQPRGRSQCCYQPFMGVASIGFAEKRKAPREGCRIAVNFDFEDKTHEALILNMSKTGFFISNSSRMPEGRDLRLTLDSPEKGSSTCIGKVVWANQDGMGIQLQ